MRVAGSYPEAGWRLRAGSAVIGATKKRRNAARQVLCSLRPHLHHSINEFEIERGKPGRRPEIGIAARPRMLKWSGWRIDPTGPMVSAMSASGG